MSGIPRQRKAGQVGGGGRIGQTSNRGLSSSRGGRPHAGGGGGGMKPPKDDGWSCAVTALAGLGLIGVLGASALYLMAQIVRAVVA